MYAYIHMHVYLGFYTFLWDNLKKKEKSVLCWYITKYNNSTYLSTSWGFAYIQMFIWNSFIAIVPFQIILSEPDYIIQWIIAAKLSSYMGELEETASVALWPATPREFPQAVLGNVLRVMVFGFKKWPGCLGGVEGVVRSSPRDAASTWHPQHFSPSDSKWGFNMWMSALGRFESLEMNHLLIVLSPKCF